MKSNDSLIDSILSIDDTEYAGMHPSYVVQHMKDRIAEILHQHTQPSASADTDIQDKRLPASSAQVPTDLKTDNRILQGLKEAIEHAKAQPEADVVELLEKHADRADRFTDETEVIETKWIRRWAIAATAAMQPNRGAPSEWGQGINDAEAERLGESGSTPTPSHHAQQPDEYTPKYEPDRDHRGRVLGQRWVNAGDAPPVSTKSDELSQEALAEYIFNGRHDTHGNIKSAWQHLLGFHGTEAADRVRKYRDVARLAIEYFGKSSKREAAPERKPYKDVTYIATWAKNASLYNLMECDNKTYKRRIVASFDESTMEENKMLAEYCAYYLNNPFQISPTPTVRESLSPGMMDDVVRDMALASLNVLRQQHGVEPLESFDTLNAKEMNQILSEQKAAFAVLLERFDIRRRG